jgi:hypothetical protein
MQSPPLPRGCIRMTLQPTHLSAASPTPCPDTLLQGPAAALPPCPAGNWWPAGQAAVNAGRGRHAQDHQLHKPGQARPKQAKPGRADSAASAKAKGANAILVDVLAGRQTGWRGTPCTWRGLAPPASACRPSWPEPPGSRASAGASLQGGHKVGRDDSCQRIKECEAGAG